MRHWILAAFMGLLLLSLTSAQAGDKKGTVVELDNLKSAAPAEWKSKESTFKTRLHTFIPPKTSGVEADAEIQVIFFGKDSGGGLQENINRWKSMFVAPEGKKIDDLAKLEKFKVGNVEVVSLDIEGIYLEKFPPFAPNAKTIRRENYRRVNVYFNSDNGPFFIIFVGPAKTVAQNKKAFDDWLKNFK